MSRNLFDVSKQYLSHSVTSFVHGTQSGTDMLRICNQPQKGIPAPESAFLSFEITNLAKSLTFCQEFNSSWSLKQVNILQHNKQNPCGGSWTSRLPLWANRVHCGPVLFLGAEVFDQVFARRGVMAESDLFRGAGQLTPQQV